MRLGLPLVLFLATIGTTTWALGPAFSATLMSILVAHEMGHYVVARWHGIPATPPHFIPLPPLGVFHLGTLGAVIAVRTEHASRNQLLDVGAAGPLAGFVVAVPAMILGLSLSEPVMPTDLGPTRIYFGDSLLSWVLQQWVVGPLPDGMDLEAHPVFLGAWAGFLVTAINLLPMGQLDGGHVLYAVSPQRSATWMRWVFRVLLGLGGLGLGIQVVWGLAATGTEAVAGLAELVEPLRRWLSPAFLIWAAMGWLTGLVHPPLSRQERLRPRSRWLAGACAVVMLLTFMPSPAWTEVDPPPRGADGT
jgi:membrane-associated protease RseP (regulator of RpoE activity)